MQAPPGNVSPRDGRDRPSDDNMQGGFGGSFGGARGQGGPDGGGGPGGTGEGGQKGIFRLFNQQMAGQISWMIPMALFGVLILSLRLGKSEAGDKKAVVRHLLLWTAWIVPMFVYFSMAGFFHRYYLSMIAPGIAALSGIGIVEMWKAYLQRGWKWLVLPAALLAGAAVQSYILSRYTGWSKILIPAVCGITLACVIILIVLRILNKDYYDKTIKATVAAGFAALLIAPAIWAYTPIMYGSEATLPIAGPELNRGNNNRGFNQIGGGMAGSPESNASSGLINFLMNNKRGEKYLVAVPNATSASSIILETGEPVMAVGGFLGSDPILTVDKLESMVKNGEIRYFMAQGMGAQSEIYSWVRSHGTVVTSDKWSDTASTQGGFGQFGRGMGGGTTLYDLAPEKGSN